MALHTTIEKAKAYSASFYGTMRLDVVERILLFVALGWFVSRLSLSLTREPYNIIIMISESIPVLMLVIRKPGNISTGFYAWTVAIIGTFTPLMLTVTGSAFISAAIGGAVMSFGLMISIAAKVCLNRSFGIVAANRGVKREGPYRLVRHPMYLGYIVTQVGFLLVHFSLANALVCGVTWIALALRIQAEESFLNQDGAYRNYSAAVRYRVIPGII
ncbi:MAG: isoprenylcysteine carboxylmethyltransferase family protein [Hymenobacter sp.]|nr:MAG: isoprenylcysteine carboxylmethyltransferase family protein [Hymenobacter sp.]